MGKYKVSIIVPVYKVEKYLDRCINSLVNQTLKDIEIILVDDGSPDKCPEICDGYMNKYANIKVIHKKNEGLGVACNSGMKIATGEYIAFCDSDDWVDKGMYEQMYKAALDYNADIVYTGLKRVNSSKEVKEYLSHPKQLEIYKGSNAIETVLLDFISSSPADKLDHRFQVSAKVCLYRHSILINNNCSFVSERILPSEDLIFNLSVIDHVNCVCFIPAYFYNYFQNDKSITSTIKPNHFRNMINTANYIFNLLNKEQYRGIIEDIKTRLNRLIIAEARSFTQQIILSKLSYSQKKILVKDISKNSTLQEVNNSYPKNEMPVVHRIILDFILNNRIIPLIVIFKLKNLLKYR